MNVAIGICQLGVVPSSVLLQFMGGDGLATTLLIGGTLTGSAALGADMLAIDVRRARADAGVGQGRDWRDDRSDGARPRCRPPHADRRRRFRAGHLGRAPVEAIAIFVVLLAPAPAEVEDVAEV